MTERDYSFLETVRLGLVDVPRGTSPVEALDAVHGLAAPLAREIRASVTPTKEVIWDTPRQGHCAFAWSDEGAKSRLKAVSHAVTGDMLVLAYLQRGLISDGDAVTARLMIGAMDPAQLFALIAADPVMRQRSHDMVISHVVLEL